MIKRTFLRPDYSISSIIKGGWHLAGGHGMIDVDQALEDMKTFAETGITTFDCADIYTGVEALIGKFLRKYIPSNSGGIPEVQIHTKYVPDYDRLATLTKRDTETIIDRSLRRLGVDRLDLVQFAWWDFAIKGHIKTCLHLKELQESGKIKHLGVTNYDAKHLKELLDADIDIVSNQVQYSLLDQRPASNLADLCKKNNIHLLCYGVLAGGFLSNRYLAAVDPAPPLENRSLTKYRLVIDEFGGYGKFQELLSGIQAVASKHQVGIAEIAIKYILQKDQVAAAIVGARNNHHLHKITQMDSINLDASDINHLDRLVRLGDGPKGPVYQLERDKKGRHGRIMKYDLNSKP